MKLQLLDPKIPLDQYTPIDLSVHNQELAHYTMSDPASCQAYIDVVLERANAQVAYGGYLEHRNLYRTHKNFNLNEQVRNIHLGIDFWTKAGTAVIAPLSGSVHSFKNNASSGDYGPTIILAHHLKHTTFYTLYGHLSLESLYNLSVGMEIAKGQSFARLGTPEINVNYAPHLHFQVIKTLETYVGDYPGVCSKADSPRYKANCPDPMGFAWG